MHSTELNTDPENSTSNSDNHYSQTTTTVYAITRTAISWQNKKIAKGCHKTATRQEIATTLQNVQNKKMRILQKRTREWQHHQLKTMHDATRTTMVPYMHRNDDDSGVILFYPVWMFFTLFSIFVLTFFFIDSDISDIILFFPSESCSSRAGPCWASLASEKRLPAHEEVFVCDNVVATIWFASGRFRTHRSC